MINIVINFYIQFITTYTIPPSIGMSTHKALYCCIMFRFIYLYNIYSVSNVNKCSTRWYFVFIFDWNTWIQNTQFISILYQQRGIWLSYRIEECIVHKKKFKLFTRCRLYAIYNLNVSCQSLNTMFTTKLLQFTHKEY